MSKLERTNNEKMDKELCAEISSVVAKLESSLEERYDTSDHSAGSDTSPGSDRTCSIESWDISGKNETSVIILKNSACHIFAPDFCFSLRLICANRNA